MTVTLQSRKYQTQWAAQFYAAAELTRRGYLVSLTFGNASEIDLLAVSPSGKHFAVDVKGQSTRNFWLIQQRKNRDDLYFIVAGRILLPQKSWGTIEKGKFLFQNYQFQNEFNWLNPHLR